MIYIFPFSYLNFENFVLNWLRWAHHSLSSIAIAKNIFLGGVWWMGGGGYNEKMLYCT